MSGTVKIGTHNGIFHCDEVLACYMLKKTFPYGSRVEIVRSRDPRQLEPCDIVVDVGDVYDPSKNRYDHHQNSFQLTMSSLRPNIRSSVRLSSAGLIYHHFGEAILKAVASEPLDQIMLEKLFKFVYFNFIQEIDAIDNGVPMFEAEKPRYAITTHLSNRVFKLNRFRRGSSNEERQFEKAMALVGGEFEDCVETFISRWPARRSIETAFNERFKVHPSGKIISTIQCAWKDHLYDLEEEHNVLGEVKFLIYELKGAKVGWRVAAVPVDLPQDYYQYRVPLAWKGLHDQELQQASGVRDAIFVHATGFIGDAGSRAGALSMAVKSLEISEQELVSSVNKLSL